MARYRLDDLGWYQFEHLAQSLMKSRLGMGVECWGGSRDYGRDAYFKGSLRFPSNDVSDGPFIFQAKFVSEANAAGAKPFPLLKTAVQKELNRVRERIADGTWERPAWYVLLTNSPLSADERMEITSLFSPGQSVTEGVSLQDGNDLGALLDEQPKLRQAFPQLLSLADLDGLLKAALKGPLLSRSEAAISSARTFVDTFVATETYNRAVAVFQKHNFVVLEGPPEMGKTAIAWMLALGLASQGWEALVCDKPQDFFDGFEAARKQVFVADDAFGRTEYDPTRGSYWEHDLDRVLQRLDRRHRLVWTSRKHILERALTRLDLQGKASNFPKPAAVLVNASYLSLNDKALILYRHLKRVPLPPRARARIRQALTEGGRAILANKHFTPERIRRYVIEASSEIITQIDDGKVPAKLLLEQMIIAMSNPTDQMRKTFRALDIGYKWLLVSLLEAESAIDLDELRKLYSAHCPVEQLRDFNAATDELEEGFLRRLYRGTNYEAVTWIHPSYRDLVIEELGLNAALRQRFLTNTGTEGIKLALSVAGGAQGKRALPLLREERDWTALGRRTQQLIRTKMPSSAIGIFEAFAGAADAVEDDARLKLSLVVLRACAAARRGWKDRPVSIAALAAYRDASVLVHPLPPMIDLRATWEKAITEVDSAIFSKDPDAPMALEALAELADFTASTEPRFLTQVNFLGHYRELQNQIREVATPILDDAIDNTSPDEASEGATRSKALASAMRVFEKFDPDFSTEQGTLIASLEEQAEKYTSRASELATDDDDYEPDDRSSDEVAVESIFADL